MAHTIKRGRIPSSLQGLKLNKDPYTTPQNTFVSIENILKSDLSIEAVADQIHDAVLMEADILTRKDSLDRFLDFVIFKAKTGYDFIENLAYPSKRIGDPEIEEKVKQLINIHLLPTIIFSLLKFFTRNVQNSDINLYLAYLLESDEVIQPVYDTYCMFKKDIFKQDREARSNNVKRLQQYVLSADEKYSSPLDAACRLKYILEYIALNQDVSHIYTKEDLKLKAIVYDAKKG
ncbi:MAG: hypothetical protein ACRCUT_05085 [Spirochaetota bacterium]